MLVYLNRPNFRCSVAHSRFTLEARWSCNSGFSEGSSTSWGRIDYLHKNEQELCQWSTEQAYQIVFTLVTDGVGNMKIIDEIYRRAGLVVQGILVSNVRDCQHDKCLSNRISSLYGSRSLRVLVILLTQTLRTTILLRILCSGFQLSFCKRSVSYASRFDCFFPWVSLIVEIFLFAVLLMRKFFMYESRIDISSG